VVVFALASVSAFAAEESEKTTTGSGGFFQNMADCIGSWGK